jgi:hypothetical protein
MMTCAIDSSRLAGSRQARDDGVEAFPSGGEIDKRGEYGDLLVEEELRALQSGEYGVLQRLHGAPGAGCLMCGMKAAIGRVCAVAERDEAVTGQHRHVAVRVLRTSG